MTCNTAPGVTFRTREALMEHYKSDWHRWVYLGDVLPMLVMCSARSDAAWSPRPPARLFLPVMSQVQSQASRREARADRTR